SVDDYLTAVRRETSGGTLTPTASAVEGLLPRIEVILNRHLEVVLRLKNAWQREREDCHHRYEEWKLIPKPDPFREGERTVETIRYNWALLLCLLPAGGVLWFALQASSTWLWVAAAMCLLIVGGVFWLYFTKQLTETRKTQEPNPEYERFDNEGRELLRR